MSNFQLSSSCQPLSPLSSHQRPTLAFCPPANGWKLLEMLEHMLLPLAIALSLCTPIYLQPQSAKSEAYSLHIHCKSQLHTKLYLYLHLLLQNCSQTAHCQHWPTVTIYRTNTYIYTYTYIYGPRLL